MYRISLFETWSIARMQISNEYIENDNFNKTKSNNQERKYIFIDEC